MGLICSDIIACVLTVLQCLVAPVEKACDAGMLDQLFNCAVYSILRTSFPLHTEL